MVFMLESRRNCERDRGLSVVTTSWMTGIPGYPHRRPAGQYGLTALSRAETSKLAGDESVQIRDLSSRFEIVLTLLEHRMLDQLSDGEAARATLGFARVGRTSHGKPCRPIAFLGQIPPGAVELGARAGYLSARTTRLSLLSFPRRVEGLALIPPPFRPTPFAARLYENALKRRSLGNLMRTGALFYRRTWLRSQGSCSSGLSSPVAFFPLGTLLEMRQSVSGIG